MLTRIRSVISTTEDDQTDKRNIQVLKAIKSYRKTSIHTNVHFSINSNQAINSKIRKMEIQTRRGFRKRPNSKIVCKIKGKERLITTEPPKPTNNKNWHVVAGDDEEGDDYDWLMLLQSISTNNNNNTSIQKKKKIKHRAKPRIQKS